MGIPVVDLHSSTFDFLRDTFVILQICKVFLFLTRDKNNKSTLQIYGTCRRRRFVKYFYFHVALVQIATSREVHPQIWYKATSKRTFARVHLSTLTSTLRTLLSQLSLKVFVKGVSELKFSMVVSFWQLKNLRVSSHAISQEIKIIYT